MEFKIRCSAIGQIMTSPRTKGATLSETAKSELELLLLEEDYDRKAPQVDSKYTRKGNAVEGDAIDFAQSIMEPGGIWFKNETRFEDEHLKGTPDLIVGDFVYDIKASWMFTTFPRYKFEPPPIYWWQLQGYMALTGRKRAAVLYCLMTAPEVEIFQEARRVSYQRGFGGDIDPVIDEVRHLLTYDNDPIEKRFKAFPVERDDAAIQSIRDRVEACRDYICELKEKV